MNYQAKRMYPTKDQYLSAQKVSSQKHTLLNDYERGAWDNICMKIEQGQDLYEKQIAFWWRLLEKMEREENNYPENNYPNIIALLSKAGERKNPILRPQLCVSSLKIKRNNPQYSRFPNDYTVKGMIPGMGDTYLGALRAADGAYIPARGLQREVISSTRKKLANLNSDPQKAILEDDSHYCVFCARELENEESRRRHYGPICADNYGLPYDHSKNSSLQ